MPPLPVIAGIYRVTLNGATFQGITPRNVFHIATASEDVGDIGAALDDAFDAGPLLLPSQASFQPADMDILPLDGVTPTATFPVTHELAAGAGQMVPEACAVMSFSTGQRGPRGRGRMFIGPVAEGTIEDGFVVSSVQTDLETAWGDFITALGTGDPAIGLVIASYVHADFNIVQGFHCDPGVGTQRRRLLQQRA